MAINSNTPRQEFIASSGQTEFVFNFKIFNTSDIKVYKTPSGQIANDTSDILIENTDYAVTINGDAGGTISLTTGASLNDQLTLLRELPVTRNTEYQQGGDILASTMNNEEDYQTYLIQQNTTNATRFLSIQDSAQNFDTKLPSPQAFAYFRWNSTGTAIENDTAKPEWITEAEALRDETEVLHDIVVAKEAIVNPHYNYIDIVGSDLNGYYIINSADNGLISDDLDAPVNQEASNIATVAASITNVDSVGSNITAVNTVYTNITGLNSIYSNITEILNSQSYATTASNAATTSTTQAGISTDSANAAASAQIAAEAARDSALSAYDSFDDRYLGAKTSDPTVDNDGNPLIAGTLYFNSTTEVMMLYTGTAWVAAYVSAEGSLLAANNLSDISSPSVARTNLGVAIGVNVQAYDANIVSDANYVHTDNNYTTTEKNKLTGIEEGAEVNVNADWNSISGDSQILNKPTIPTLTSELTNDSNFIDTTNDFTLDLGGI